ncbi:MAG TPA: 16S rRNA (cytosine(1402)-N(4))-methyltransferase RsmH, partial [Bacteroidales bacterium]|nr:16S rRNA (cytosine(1402)-N(4))-methyltransferase RsmH [Bacteroidales bacterium]
LIGIDQDTDALKNAEESLKEYDNVILVHSNFENIKSILEEHAPEGADGILMDLGVSSYQLDEGERGFSYMKDAPLDMRMNREDVLSAYDVINKYEEEDIYRIIRDYGEEKWAKRIAEFITKARGEKPVETTLELVEIIKKAIPAKARREGPHPAKRTFQAIRIEVNRELTIIRDTILDAVNGLRPEGRLAIITFHSLEDRIVKTTYKELMYPCTCPTNMPCICGKTATVKILTKKPILPGELEIEENPRSRSAKLRVLEKL